MTDDFGFPKMLAPHSFSFQTVKGTNPKCSLYNVGLILLLLTLNNYFMSMFWSELVLLKIPSPWLVWAGNRQTVMQSTCVLNNEFPVREIMFLCICFSTLHRFDIVILTQEAWFSCHVCKHFARALIPRLHILQKSLKQCQICLVQINPKFYKVALMLLQLWWSKSLEQEVIYINASVSFPIHINWSHKEYYFFIKMLSLAPELYFSFLEGRVHIWLHLP